MVRFSSSLFLQRYLSGAAQRARREEQRAEWNGRQTRNAGSAEGTGVEKINIWTQTVALRTNTILTCVASVYGVLEFLLTVCEPNTVEFSGQLSSLAATSDCEYVTFPSCDCWGTIFVSPVLFATKSSASCNEWGLLDDSIRWCKCINCAPWCKNLRSLSLWVNMRWKTLVSKTNLQNDRKLWVAHVFYILHFDFNWNIYSKSPAEEMKKGREVGINLYSLCVFDSCVPESESLQRCGCSAHLHVCTRSSSICDKSHLNSITATATKTSDDLTMYLSLAFRIKSIKKLPLQSSQISCWLNRKYA